MTVVGRSSLLPVECAQAEFEHLAQLALRPWPNHTNEVGCASVCGIRRLAVATSEAAEPGMVSHDGGISLALV